MTVMTFASSFQQRRFLGGNKSSYDKEYLWTCTYSKICGFLCLLFIITWNITKYYWNITLLVMKTLFLLRSPKPAVRLPPFDHKENHVHRVPTTYAHTPPDPHTSQQSSSQIHTAFSKQCWDGACIRSTKGCVKNSSNVIRSSGLRFNSLSKRSRQLSETCTPGGNWKSKVREIS
jgi:hypothetical protein